MRKRVLDIKRLTEFFGIDTDPIMGIDIGSTSVKMMGLSGAPGNITVNNFAMQAIEPGVIIEKNILDPEKVILAVKEAFEKSGATSKNVCISLPNSMAITRIIKMSSEMDDKEIGSEIELEAERYIPYKLSDINLDYKVLGPTDNPDLVNVILVASKKDNVELLTSIIESAGLNVKIMDLDSFALGRAFELVTNKFPAHGKNKIFALFDIGSTLTSLNIYCDNNVIYSREQAFGSQQLIDEVQSVYGLNYNEASLAIKYDNLPKDYGPEILDPFKQVICQQISRFCQFFYSTGDYSVIDYILLTGGCSAIYGLDQVIQDKLKIKTLIANPILDFKISDSIDLKTFKSEEARLMKCCGLALRNLTNDKY